LLRTNNQKPDFSKSRASIPSLIDGVDGEKLILIVGAYHFDKLTNLGVAELMYDKAIDADKYY
jgi:hypothetical protein